MAAAVPVSPPTDPLLTAVRAAPSVAATATALPPHRYDQRALAQAASRMLPALQRREGFLERFFDRVGVDERYLALDAEAYGRLEGFGDRSRAFVEVATDLGQACLEALFEGAGVDASQIDMLMTTTVTGVAVPSIDARLMNRLPFDPALKRMPLFGLGCLGGAAGLARAAEYLLAFPDHLAVLLSVELCSLTLQPDDASVANVISSGLFGDGSGAVLLAGRDHPLAVRRGSAGGGNVDRGDVDRGPKVVASRSAFFPDTERVMGWDMVDTGFKIVLDPSVPDVVRAHLPAGVDAFLGDHGLARSDIATWVCHPGGPAVMTAVEECLALPTDALAASHEALAKVGNLSSASVLYLLDDFRARRRPDPGAFGLLLAMGPAFCAELVLLRW